MACRGGGCEMDVEVHSFPHVAANDAWPEPLLHPSPSTTSRGGGLFQPRRSPSNLRPIGICCGVSMASRVNLQRVGIASAWSSSLYPLVFSSSKYSALGHCIASSASNTTLFWPRQNACGYCFPIPGAPMFCIDDTSPDCCTIRRPGSTGRSACYDWMAAGKH